MIAKITPSRACGSVSAPASKSMAHRLLIAAAMASGVSTVRGISSCSDVSATVDCLRALGVKIEETGKDLTVHGLNMKNARPSRELYCRESGSTQRFLIPIALLSGIKTAVSGARSLMKRPLSVYEDMAREKDFLFTRENGLIFVKGPLKSGEYTLRGDVSSQFISGLLFALPVLSDDSTIKITPPFESRSYVLLTIAALREFGVFAEFEDEYTIKVPGNQKYKPCDVTVEGDYSGAAFLDAFNYIGGEVTVSGLLQDSVQGDRVYTELFPLLKTGTPKIDVTDCPDLSPILFTLAAAFSGAEFTGTKRLKIKESDRAETMAEELRKFGANIEVFENSVLISGATLHAPSEPILAHNDHRVAMSLSVLLTLFGGELHGAESVSKSYPSFFDDIKKLGIEVTINE